MGRNKSSLSLIARLVSPANLRSYSAQVGGRFAHMGKTDLRIWRTRLSMQPLVDAVEYYDVRAGWGAIAGVGMGDDEEQPWLRLVSKRIDVVLEYADRFEIWEVKSLSSMAMLGQLLTYETLFVERYSPTKPVKLWGCCENVDDDVWPLLSAFGVSLFVVGERDEPAGLFPKILAAEPR